MKTCNNCGLSKQESEYSKRKDTKSGLSATCKKCRKKLYPATQSTKHKAWVRNIKRLYGITPDDYNRMYEDQKGCCKVCGNQSGNTKFHIDHCHDTGKVRGLLCDTCNRGLGYFKDDTRLLQNSIEYLEANARRLQNLSAGIMAST